MNIEKINTKQLAELVGILLGDGSISLRSNSPTMNNRIKISFNSIEDIEYIAYVKHLLEKLFRISPILKFRKSENTADLFIFNKAIILFVVNDVGLKLSPKWGTASIPKPYLKPGLDLCVIRGLFDTDGCLVTTNNNGTIYPRLEVKICPSPMQGQVIAILNRYNFHFGVYKIGKGKIRIQLNGRKQLAKWISLISFNNQRHLQKISKFM